VNVFTVEFQRSKKHVVTEVEFLLLLVLLIEADLSSQIDSSKPSIFLKTFAVHGP
jgi:hypothetical protein